ncbi:T-cell leukemia translocation-altered gene protein isoform X1 [Camelus dromedarius]|uniref:T-cell leukemia translocation-altered gene protein isoform X1 n=3 Tax=Camelus TaxID=9836 RepID=A0A8B8RAY4_CAMFR|nr:T-cell leukemia translocation-altered gene protein isoform X1 [Camelus dromedarius]XP_032314405.1 T-cell leukemia translocation-altered gene protein isoform X1 [Camelus ferus]XP_045362001.1 T-cell leukemia translocation-altered gene protein isoform X1 [Camelus bactrianus]
MAEPWSGQSLQTLSATVLGALGALGSEFLREWEAQDMRVTLFKLLLLWLVLSLLGIQLAWGFYGSTVTGLYHRPVSLASNLTWADDCSDTLPKSAAALDVFLPPGLGGQNGSTPDGSTHFPSWETAANEPLKTHRE